MNSGSFDGRIYAKLQDLKQRMEFQKEAQAEIGDHRSQFSEEMHQRILVLKKSEAFASNL